MLRSLLSSVLFTCCLAALGCSGGGGGGGTTPLGDQATQESPKLEIESAPATSSTTGAAKE